jgi:hypothetical protein
VNRAVFENVRFGSGFMMRILSVGTGHAPESGQTKKAVRIGRQVLFAWDFVSLSLSEHIPQSSDFEKATVGSHPRLADSRGNHSRCNFILAGKAEKTIKIRSRSRNFSQQTDYSLDEITGGLSVELSETPANPRLSRIWRNSVSMPY